MVELVITVALVAIVMGGVISAMGAASGARLRRSAVMIAGAVRVAYAHANVTTKPVRLVFDFEQRLVTLEEASQPMLVMHNDAAAGAAAATQAEAKAAEEADAIMKGPTSPRATFRPAKALGFNTDAAKKGKELDTGIRFLQVEVAHQDSAQVAGRAYLYFWPGGQTERASIQLAVARADGLGDVMTLLISPLTGKSDIRKGKVMMLRPRDDLEASERSDQGL